MLPLATPLTQEQQAVILQLQEIYQQTGKRPALYRHKQLKLRILICFPDYDSAFRAANLPVIHPTDDDLIKSIQEFHEIYGRIPTRNEACQGGLLKYSLTCYEAHYPLWNDLITASGFKPRIRNGWATALPRRVLIRRLQRLALRLGRIPTMADIKADQTMPSVHYYKKEFGSWVNACKVARLAWLLGLEFSDGQMLRYLRKMARQLGHTPSCAEFGRRSHRPGLRLGDYKKRFGSWNKAVIAAGLPTNLTDPRWQDRLATDDASEGDRSLDAASDTTAAADLPASIDGAATKDDSSDVASGVAA